MCNPMQPEPQSRYRTFPSTWKVPLYSLSTSHPTRKTISVLMSFVSSWIPHTMEFHSNYAQLIPLCQASFIQHNVLPSSIFWTSWIRFHFMNITPPVYPFSFWWTVRLFAVFSLFFTIMKNSISFCVDIYAHFSWGNVYKLNCWDMQ